MDFRPYFGQHIREVIAAFRRVPMETATRTWWTKTARIKEKYPHPRVSSGGPSKLDYCVGGAMMRYYGLNGGFPDAPKLRDGLVKVNPHLSSDHALAFAKEIIVANDSGKFCEAWDALERALTF